MLITAVRYRIRGTVGENGTERSDGRESHVGQTDIKQAVKHEVDLEESMVEYAADIGACHDAWEAVQAAPAGNDGLLDMIDAAHDACAVCAWRGGAPDCNTQDAAVDDAPPANSPDRGIIP